MNGQDTIKKRALAGLGWSFAGSFGGRLLVFAATLVLARVLSPADFGLVAFALAILAYLEGLSDLGASQALIYRSNARDRQTASTAFWSGVLGSIALFAVTWALAPAIAGFGPDSGGDDLIWIIRILALQFLLTAASSVQRSLLRRDLQFQRILPADLLSGLAKGVTSIALALLGAGVWSLVVGQLAGVLVSAVVLWIIAGWRPRMSFSRKTAREMLSFGLATAAAAVVGQGIWNVDYLIVGAQLGATDLGYYVLSFRLPELVILPLFVIGWRVLFPMYARIREASEDGEASSVEALDWAYIQTTRLASLVAFPLGFGVAVFAWPTVLVLYGEKWEQSALPMSILGMWAAFTAVSGTPGTVFQALGRSGLLLRVTIVYLTLLLPALVLASRVDIAAVAAAHLGVQLIYYFGVSLVTARILHHRWFASFAWAAPPFLLSGLSAGLVVPIVVLLPPAAALALGIPAGLALYLLLLRLVRPEDLRFLVRTIQSVKSRVGYGPTGSPIG